MVVGVPKETADGERRVAIVPDVVKRLQAKDVEVVIESGAGEAALIPDAPFGEVGAKSGAPWNADGGGKGAGPPSSGRSARRSATRGTPTSSSRSGRRRATRSQSSATAPCSSASSRR